MNDNYFKKLFRKYYVPENEIQTRINNAAEFSIYLIQHPEKLDLIYDWWLNIYFYGLGENPPTILFEEDIKRFAKGGYLYVPTVLHEAIGSIAENSPIGCIIDVWNESSPYCLDSIEKEVVIELLEETKVKCDDYVFLDIDWDYFLTNCWADLFHEIFEFYYGTSYERAIDNPINKKIDKMMEKEGLKLTYIKELSSKQKMSCIGFDMSTAWPQTSTKDLILKVSNKELFANKVKD